MQDRAQPSAFVAATKQNPDKSQAERAARPTASNPLEKFQRAADRSMIVAQTGALQRAADKLQLTAPCDTAPIQAAFKPVVAASNAHLRNLGAWNDKVGARIDKNQEFIADPFATQQGQENLAFNRTRDTTWAPAVHVSAETWDHAVHAGQSTFVRASRVDANARQFPEAADDVELPDTQRNLKPNRDWHERYGIYVDLEPSVSVPGARIVLKNGAPQRLSGAGFAALDAHERLQLNDADLRNSINTRALGLLQTAVGGRPWAAAFHTQANINKLIFDSDGGSKAIRWIKGHSLQDEQFVNWYRWLDGPFNRIRDGAQFMVAALDHWQAYLFPADPTQVAITGIRLTGSDLHEEGLGAVFVDFTKPAGPIGHKFAAETNLTLIIKSEDKSLEKELFGSEDGSLANQINDMANLNPAEALSTFRMETSHAYGSLIEMVHGVQADTFDRPQAVSPAMREAMVFAFITGLSDLHRENVLWHNGRPYFIDADNAMNNARVNFELSARARNQSGLTGYAGDGARDFLTQIEDDPNAANSKLMGLLVTDDPSLLEPVIDAVRNSFAGKTGRVVPINTEAWAAALRGPYIGLPQGQATDDHFQSRWGLANKYALRVPTGSNFESNPPGLEGETGTAAGGAAFQSNREAQQIKADYDKGQIPFYNYDFDTGYVTHNGQVVWNGEPLSDVLETLLSKFPAQRDTWQTE
ncbi:MAG: hypothetical protein AB8B62_15135 [Roseobacter sp.]